jgi:hypothetical protein
MRRLFVLAVVAGSSVVAGASAASPLPRILSCAGKPLVRPAGLVVLSCADANSELRATHWQSWSGSGAVGTTDFGLNLCTPSCAASKIRFFPNSHVRLSGAEHTKRGLLFDRATVTYVLHGKTKTFVAYLPTRPL